MNAEMGITDAIMVNSVGKSAKPPLPAAPLSATALRGPSPWAEGNLDAALLAGPLRLIVGVELCRRLA
jgi:hypothetical protein